MTGEASTPNTSTESTSSIEQWDLTNTVSPYLDRHMVFPLLEFLDGLIAKQAVSYNSQDVAEARLALLRPTQMVDYAMDVYRSVHGSENIPKEMEEQKERVYQQLATLRKHCEPLEMLVKDEPQRVSCWVHAYIQYFWNRSSYNWKTSQSHMISHARSPTTGKTCRCRTMESGILAIVARCNGGNGRSVPPIGTVQF